MTKALGKCYIPECYSPIMQLGQSPVHQKSASLDNHLLIWSALTIFFLFFGVARVKRPESYKEQYRIKDGDAVCTSISIHNFS